MIKEGLNNALLINYFKYILTVDDIKKFKPNQEVYKLAPTAFNCEPNEITFFSSNNWDISCANKFRFKTIWVNRGQILSEQLPGSPDYEVQTITEALNFIEV
ncbi:MAG: 2-haloalkanoic acid dehalogenase [SAR116 cluster bacterium]|nr:MAG: 2-haloalkanoic acid dehalogenase [SAR116 cluster bacterium]